MDDYELQYQTALSSVKDSIVQAIAELEIPTEADLTLIEKSSSSLDAWDYCHAIAVGLAGVFISTNEAFAKYLDEIHKAASGNSGEYDRFQTFLGKLLHHEGDHIDMVERPFKNRNGGIAYCLFHRLLWGHDILSIGEDNPFALMYNQKGFTGILQAVRHLLADTASKQGLPLPGSSFLDVVDESNKTSYYLIKVAQQLPEETTELKTGAQEIYSHMMTIRAQDVATGVVVKAMSELYFLIRRVDDEIRRTEIRLIAYAINFFGEAVVGCIRQNGVPYINIPLAGAKGVFFAQFYYYNEKEKKQLAETTEEIHDRTNAIEARLHNPVLVLDAHDNADALIQAADTAAANIEELLDFFSEETP